MSPPPRHGRRRPTIHSLLSPHASAVLDIDLAAIAANWRLLCDKHPGGPVAAVVKANGYGLGAAPIAAHLARVGCRHFFVAHLDEAIFLRPHISGHFLAVLNGLIPGSEADFIAHDILPCLGSPPEISAWSAAARAAAKKLPALLHIDTGMSRLGLDVAQVSALVDDPSRLDGVDLRFIMTHLVSSEIAADPLNHRQQKIFGAACARLPPVPQSIANSSGIFLGPDWASDLARPGAALFGINPTPAKKNPMHPVARLTARVLQVRDVHAGETVGYNSTWTAPPSPLGPRRIAAVGIGYADGWHRILSNRGCARFDGTVLPLVGRVSMDLTTFDITARPDIAPGAMLELLGPEHGPDAVAEQAGTNGYEILTSLGARIARNYHTV
ncbi:MAG: alanine racemase [Acetobacteraceae bacterium]|nr:alanine racemase [Acetobacteraceae bacterium]